MLWIKLRHFTNEVNDTEIDFIRNGNIQITDEEGQISHLFTHIIDSTVITLLLDQ